MPHTKSPPIAAAGGLYRADPHLKNTQMCKFYMRGRCTRGKACTFAHGRSELEDRPNWCFTRLCAEFTNRGVCSQGASCRYAHSEEELRAGRLTRLAPAEMMVSSDGNPAEDKAANLRYQATMLRTARLQQQHPLSVDIMYGPAAAGQLFEPPCRDSPWKLCTINDAITNFLTQEDLPKPPGLDFDLLCLPDTHFARPAADVSPPLPVFGRSRRDVVLQ